MERLDGFAALAMTSFVLAPIVLEGMSSANIQPPSKHIVIKIVKVVDLKVVGDNSIWLRFSDGQEGIRDCADLLAQDGPMVIPLRDPVMFRRAFLSDGIPTWPNGFDLDAINLHMELARAGALKQASTK